MELRNQKHAESMGFESANEKVLNFILLEKQCLTKFYSGETRFSFIWLYCDTNWL